MTLVALNSGRVQQALLPIPNLHGIVLAGAAAPGRAVVLPFKGKDAAIIGPDLSLIKTLTAPEGWLFSGHGVHSKHHGAFLISMHRQSAPSSESHGQICILDAKTLQVADNKTSGGVHPHDCAFLSNGDLALCHYGEIDSPHASEPRLVVLDGRDLSVRKTIETPKIGVLTHLAVARDGTVGAIPLNFVPFDANGHRMVRQLLGDRDFEIGLAEKEEARYGLPMPFLLIDPATGKIEGINKAPGQQRRPQSIAYEPASGCFFATFPFSDTLMRIEPTKGIVDYLTAFDLGLSKIRGLTTLAESGMVVIAGQEEGLTFLDGRGLKIIGRLPVSLYGASHLTYAA